MARREAIHPGEFLEDELEEIGITADTALRLGSFFGTGPELWMNLQKTYDLDKAEAGIGNISGSYFRVIFQGQSKNSTVRHLLHKWTAKENG